MKKFFKKSKQVVNEYDVESKETIESSEVKSEDVDVSTETRESISIDISKETYEELVRIKEKNDCKDFTEVINGIIEALKDYQNNSENKGSDEKNG